MNFKNDKEKIRDLLWLNRNQFLSTYSYITEEEYDRKRYWRKIFLLKGGFIL